MLFKVVSFSLYCCVLSTVSYPNIFEIHTCSLMVNRTNVTFENSFLHIEYQGENVYFSAFKDLMQIGCDKNALACIRKDEKFINFIDVVEENFESVTLRSQDRCFGGNYEFQIQLGLRGEKYKFEQTKQTKCKYVLEINHEYKENCTKTIQGRKLFFNDLSKDILIETKEETVIVNLCGSSKDCGDDNVAVCSRNEATKSISSLGQVSTENIKDEKGEIVFHYKTGPRKTGKNSWIVLKCNWTTLLGPKSFRKVSGKKMEIVIETSLACRKRSQNCVFADVDNYLYDLTSLSRFEGWNLNTGNNETFKLNVCGPLDSRNLCADQQSQVCHLNGQTLNYGSSMSTIIVENDVVKFSFKDGSRCLNNIDENLMTTFELHCSFYKEEQPKLIKENNCSIDVVWNTNAACPILNDANGYKELKEIDKKPCTTEDGDLKYNLTELSMNVRNHIIEHNDLVFLINVCKPVVPQKDSVCQSYMGMCVKNNSEPNIKKRFFNIGGVQNPTVENGQLILKYSHGSFCRSHKRDASAIIYFNCSDKHEDPIFIKEKECVYEFAWNTNYACPNTIDCVLRDNLDNIINMQDVKATDLQFKINRTTYNINICRDQFTVEEDGKMENIKVVKVVHTDQKSTFVEYKLDKSCNNNRDFNTIRIYLSCDVLLNNEHYEFTNISFCTAFLNLRHNNFCYGTTDGIQHDDTPVKISPPSIIKEDNPINYYEIEDTDSKICIINYGDHEINLNNLKSVTITSATNQIYTIGINKTSCCCRHFVCNDNKPVVMLNNCPKTKVENGELKLMFNSTNGLLNYMEITFYCKLKQALPEVSLEEKSLVTFRYPLASLCDEVSNSGPIIGGIVTCILIILICLGIYKQEFLTSKCKRIKKQRVYVYCRNSEE